MGFVSPEFLQALRTSAPVLRAAIWFFVWGTLIGPGLHLAAHEPDHVHAPDGRIEWRSPTAHHHGDGIVHSHATATELPEAPADAAALCRPHPVGHGAGDALHFGLALATAAPVLVPPPPLLSEPLVPPAAPASPQPRRWPGPAAARAPPATV